MPRTAVTVTDSFGNQEVMEKPITFMTGVERETGPDYHFFTRVVGTDFNPAAGVITGDMLDAQVNGYLASGYKIVHVELLRLIEISGQPMAGFQFGYHLVRE